jgi:thioredoxin 1
MAYTRDYATTEPSRAELDAGSGPLLLEFGAPWCGYCMRAQAPLEQALANAPSVAHVKVEDGPGRPLGRSFRIKLWPTLVLLRDGAEVARLVRPDDAASIGDALAKIA